LPLAVASLVFLFLFLFDPILSPDKIVAVLGDVKNILADPSSNAAQASGTYRWTLWTEAIHLIRQHPFFGYGPDTTGILMLRDGIVLSNGVDASDRVHNEYLQYAVSIGIPGLLAWLAFLFMSLRQAIPPLFRVQEQNRTKGRTDAIEASVVACAALTYLVSAFFGNSLTYTTPFLFLLLGRCAAEARRSPLEIKH